MRTLLMRGGSPDRGQDYVAAAATVSGTLLIAYVPPGHRRPIDVDMSVMTGLARARWFDPTNGAYITVDSSLANTGSRVFVMPGRNGAGATDWVLVLDRTS